MQAVSKGKKMDSSLELPEGNSAHDYSTHWDLCQALDLQNFVLLKPLGLYYLLQEEKV